MIETVFEPELTYEQLLAQREAIEAQIAEARKAEIEKAVETVRKLVADFDLSMDDLFPQRTKRQRESKGTVLPIKYRDPATGSTWTGRGREPIWIKGKDRAQFAV